MTRISYLNGQFLPHENCLVHIEDRGFQFADGIYEVTLFKNGRLIDGNAHLARLFRNLNEINIAHHFSKEELTKMQLKLFALNQMSEGICYLQITRGCTNRIPQCPKGLTPTINATVSLGKKISAEEFSQGFSVMTHQDIRWHRCDIKTVGLLASSLMNQKAKDSGFDDVIFIRDGVITEASFANAFIVNQEGILITKDADQLILCGITRNRLIDLAKKNGLQVEERKFGIDELMKAKEVFLTSSSLILRPVVRIDNQLVSDGKVGKVAQLLSEAYKNFIMNGS